jgi:hypothetical protein
MNSHVKPSQPATVSVQLAPKPNEVEWVLARARSMSAGLRLIQLEIDEVGISLKNGWITPETAASNLAALEQIPVMVASIFYQGGAE